MNWPLENVLAPMQVPFPELTDLQLSSYDETPVIPDSFLGGSAPRLRTLTLDGISFPGLPKLLLSATRLVHLSLSFIPDPGYISPEVMVALLSVFSNLEILCLNFGSYQSYPVSESRSLPPIKRSILPALTRLDFQGVTEYLEELIAHIDTPQLDKLQITVLNEIGTPRVAQFINRTSLRVGDKARVEFYNGATTVELPARVGNLCMTISCTERNRQLLSVAQVCNPLHSLSTVEGLCIGSRDSHQVRRNDDAIENTLWLRVLLPFAAVKNLYLSKINALSVAAALQELVGGRILEVLPSLQNIFVERLEPSGPL
jgi:hypothetical protein